MQMLLSRSQSPRARCAGTDAPFQKDEKTSKVVIIVPRVRIPKNIIKCEAQDDGEHLPSYYKEDNPHQNNRNGIYFIPGYGDDD